MSFLSTIIKPFTAPFTPIKTITNAANYYKNHTIAGKLLSGESLGEAVKETVQEKTIIGRMASKDENIFEAVHHSVCANDVASASIFGNPDA